MTSLSLLGGVESRPLSPQQPLPDRILAAIDIGTNSIHMVIARINPELPSFSIISREKDTVRLGEYCNRTGTLTENAMQRAMEALSRCIRIAKTFKAEAIIAVATSAVREAPNGIEFLQQVEQRLGLTVDLISGQEEARRIYLGVLSAIKFDGKPHVIADIGGGSTELILGDGHEPDFLRSVKVGAVRLSQQFLQEDPPTSQQLHALQDYVRGMVEAPIEQIKQMAASQPLRLVGTSGTIETLAMLEVRRRSGEDPLRLHGYTLSYETVKAWVKELSALPLSRRVEIPGLIERRAEIIIAGAVILQEIMRLLGATQVMVCERSLRDGLIVDWMLTHGLIEDRLRYQSSVRRRHVLKLANKYQVEMDYAERVAAFALDLFDQTRGSLHNWGSQERDFLWAAAMLHNCGHFVSHSAHHKHSYYLIRYGDLLGFNEEEIEVIANLARYHRKSAPRRKHENYLRLASDTYREIVADLSPMLRMATALDRTRHGAIQSLRCQFTAASGARPAVMQLYLQPANPTDPCELELWSLGYKKMVFEQQFSLQVMPQLETNG
jgi:exopolyphosphatase/guanosine-5'-triphosphate,3'-diphosphate pyrophosphatase